MITIWHTTFAWISLLSLVIGCGPGKLVLGTGQSASPPLDASAPAADTVAPEAEPRIVDPDVGGTASNARGPGAEAGASTADAASSTPAFTFFAVGDTRPYPDIAQLNRNWLRNWNTNLSGQRALGHNGADGLYFAVRHRNALFLVLDSEHASSTQRSWLEQTLRDAAADPTIQWKLAFYHARVYPCNYKTPFAEGLPWVRLFEQYAVDLVFNGHAHVYERSCPMVGGCCQAGGVTYVISGGGGAETVDVDPTRKATVAGESYDCSETLKVGKGNWHPYCHVTVGATTLRYACYGHDATTSPDDTLTLSK